MRVQARLLLGRELASLDGVVDQRDRNLAWPWPPVDLTFVSNRFR